MLAAVLDLARRCVSWEYRRLRKVRAWRAWRNGQRAKRRAHEGRPMPLVTVIGPGTRVVVAGFNLPGATVERVEMREGASPLVYAVKWRESPNGPIRRGTWRGDQVTEAEPTESPALPASNKLADLGRQLAAQLGPQPRG